MQIREPKRNRDAAAIITGLCGALPAGGLCGSRHKGRLLGAAIVFGIADPVGDSNPDGTVQAAAEEKGIGRCFGAPRSQNTSPLSLHSKIFKENF